MYRFNVIVILFILTQLCSIGCGRAENKTDVKVEASDSIIEEPETFEILGYYRVLGYYFAYDSARTREIMDGALWRGYIKHDYDSLWIVSGRSKFYPVKDMSYMPYLYLVESSKKYTLDSIGAAWNEHHDIDWVPYLFSSVINDRLLYETGKRLMENYISRRLQGSAAPCAAPSAIIMPALRSYATPSASRSATAACRCRNRSFRKCE